MIFQLSCGRIYYLPHDNWPTEIIWCPGHLLPTKVLAIECREWKIKCNACRYGRWCGYAEEIAGLLAARHEANCLGPVNIDFLMEPEKEKYLRKAYPKSVLPRVTLNIPMYVWTGPPLCEECQKPQDKCWCVPF